MPLKNRLFNTNKQFELRKSRFYNAWTYELFPKGDRTDTYIANLTKNFTMIIRRMYYVFKAVQWCTERKFVLVLQPNRRSIYN